jgi:hypothetical protein
MFVTASFKALQCGEGWRQRRPAKFPSRGNIVREVVVGLGELGESVEEDTLQGGEIGFVKVRFTRILKMQRVTRRAVKVFEAERRSSGSPSGCSIPVLLRTDGYLG